MCSTLWSEEPVNIVTICRLKQVTAGMPEERMLWAAAVSCLLFVDLILPFQRPQIAFA